MVTYSFLHRWNVLWRARRDLSAGAPERALQRLCDPTVGSSAAVRDLRARTVDALCQAADQRASAGRDASVARLLGLVEREDPARAAHWKRRLIPSAFSRRFAGSNSLDADALGAEQPQPLKEVLAKLRARKQANLGGEFELLPELDLRQKPAAGSVQAQPARVVLGVDDAGEFLVGFGPVLVLGHERAGRADLPFLADVAPEHLRLIFGGVSFHGGATWSLQPFPEQCVLRNGELIEAGPSVPLADGDAVSLAPNLTFLFRQPDPTTGAAVLELLSGAECLGTPSVLLFGDADVDRARLGAGPSATIRAPGLASEVSLGRSPEGWVLTSEAGFWRPGSWHTDSGRARRVLASDPLLERLDLSVGAAPAGQPPFGLYLAPVGGAAFSEAPLQGT